MLTESSAITSYLLEKFDSAQHFAPPRSDLQQWAAFTQWLHYPEGSVFAPLLIKMLLLRSADSHLALEQFSGGEIARHFDYISNQLGDNEFILGDRFCAADFGISYVVALAKRLGQLDAYPALDAYLQRNFSRAAYLRAVERAVE